VPSGRFFLNRPGTPIFVRDRIPQTEMRSCQEEVGHATPTGV
jgi:hypothetical protein